jgi:hypothetical protein
MGEGKLSALCHAREKLLNGGKKGEAMGKKGNI